MQTGIGLIVTTGQKPQVDDCETCVVEFVRSLRKLGRGEGCVPKQPSFAVVGEEMTQMPT